MLWNRGRRGTVGLRDRHQRKTIDVGEQQAGLATAGSIFRPDDTCWRIERASRLAFIFDAADYFKMLRKVMLSARRELLLIGWDFDFEIEMYPGESDDDGCAPDGMPNQLGAFLEAVVKQAPDLNIYILKWNGAVLAAPGRLLPTLALHVFGDDRIHFALDGHHPFGACHHQKIIVADDAFAFCGCIDATEDRWDTPAHRPDDPRRVRKDGSPSEPWHDVTSALTGPVASALAELSRRRWLRATGDTLKRPDVSEAEIWPDALEVTARDIDVAIARTEPPYDGAPMINEIERLYLASIEMARDTIYIESQYFAADTICDAIERRLKEDGGPEVIVINPEAALSIVEDKAMHTLRSRMIDRLTQVDHQDRFRIWNPVNSAAQPIYVHAKIMIVDDRLLHIGSSNLDDRSMGFDTECDIAIADRSDVISDFRSTLLCEHLDTTRQVLDETLQQTGSLIATIETLNAAQGRGLRRIMPLQEEPVGWFLANTRLLDPRYYATQAASAGEGIRPRHLALMAGGAALGFLSWKAWQRWIRSRR